MSTTTLRDSLEEKRRALSGASQHCTEAGTSAFVQFWTTPHECVGFSTGQLLRYQLVTRQPGNDPSLPPQVLTLCFPTDDVVVTGHRLDEITTLLGEGRLAAVRTQPERFSELSPTRASVRSIQVRPLKAEPQA